MFDLRFAGGYNSRPYSKIHRFVHKIFTRSISVNINDFTVKYDFIWDENNKMGKKFIHHVKILSTKIRNMFPFTHFREIESTAYKPEHFEICKKFYGEYQYVLDLIMILDYIVLNEDRQYEPSRSSKILKNIKLVNIPAYRKNILSVKENVEEIFWDTFENAFEEKDRLSAILTVMNSQIDKLLCGDDREKRTK